jgi:hypothetical protein
MDYIPDTEYWWPNHSDARIVKYMPYINRPYLGEFKDVIFPTLPEELMEAMTLITPDPEAWFVGQFAAYLLRPTDKFLVEYNEMKQNSHQIAMHIRRTDKKKEATPIKGSIFNNKKLLN